MSTPKPRSKILDYFILVYKPRHHRAVGDGYVPEQVLVAEEFLGRLLTPDEEVRHINGNPQDNRPSNLEIISINSDYRSQSLGDSGDIVEQRRSSKTYMPCKFQRPCWKDVRSQIAKKNKVYIPYICSFQIEGDVYKCSHFWKFLDKEMDEGASE